MTPGSFQVNYGHTLIGDKSLRETVTTFDLAGSLKAQTVVSINYECAFTGACKNICLLITEFLFRAAVGNFSRSKKLHNRAAMNNVLILTFITKAEILKREMQSVELLKKLSARILEWGSEADIKDSER